MAIKDRILNFIKTNANFTPSEIAEALNLNKNTVRGRLSELRKKYDITKREIKYQRKKTKKEIDVLKQEKREIQKLKPVEYRRKVVKTGNIESDKKGNTEVAWYYNKPISLFAVTYEANNRERNEFLIDMLEKAYEDYELPYDYFYTYGYDQEQTTTEPPFVYPNYEVSEEL